MDQLELNCKTTSRIIDVQSCIALSVGRGRLGGRCRRCLSQGNPGAAKAYVLEYTPWVPRWRFSLGLHLEGSLYTGESREFNGGGGKNDSL